MKRMIALFLFGCSAMKPSEETCLDYVEMAPRDPGRVQYVVPVVDFDAQLYAPIPVRDATFQVCLNASCDVQLPTCDVEAANCYRELPGPNPVVRVIDFPFGLTNVVLRWSAPGYIATDYVLGGPLVGSPSGELSVRGIGIVLVKETTWTSLHAQVGAVPDPTRGALATRVLDCSLQRGSGIEMAAWNADLDGGTPFSLSSSNLVTDARLTTDERGVVGFFGLPAQTLDVFLPGFDLPPVTYNIRPNTLTLAELRWGLDQFGQ